MAAPMAPDSRRGRADGEARGLEPPPSLRGVTVLLVEDDPDSRAFVERVLRDAHAAVVAVASGFEGLLSLGSRRPSVIVSDIGLPGLDGFAFLEEVRRREEARGGAPVPAIALTAFDDTAHIARAGSAGYQQHLAKPVDTDRLLLAVAEATGRVPTRDARL
jgi:CheY-like chemotaxis protein